MIGERLAEVRKDHGDTQAALAKRLRVTLSAVRSWEQEKSSPSHEMLVAICRLYHISSDYLLGLSNVDPAYEQRKRISAFSQKELDMLRDYEKYLLWRQREAYGQAAPRPARATPGPNGARAQPEPYGCAAPSGCCAGPPLRKAPSKKR